MNAERAELIAELRRPMLESQRFTDLFGRGATMLGEDARALAARFGTSIPNMQRWLSGKVVPPAAPMVLRWLADDLENQYIAAGRPCG